MWEWRTNVWDYKVALGCSFLMLWTLVAPGFGQNGGQVLSSPPSPSEQKYQDYTLGAGDVLSLTVADSPELNGKYRVAETGYILLPGLTRPIKAQGFSALELSKSIAESLKAAELIREPLVNVFVEQYRSHTVTILGAVARPSVYPLEKPTTLLETLSMAGGLLPNAGPTLTVARKSQPAGAEGPSEAELPTFDGERTMIIDLAKLMEGKDPSLNPELHAGDVVVVSTAPVVYVVGAVMRPGGFALQDPRSAVTVLQALAEAQGLKPIAAASRSLIIRRSALGNDRQEIPINVARLMAGKLADQPLEANDILFVPESNMKKSTHRMAEAAMSAVSGVVFYGLGSRVQRR